MNSGNRPDDQNKGVFEKLRRRVQQEALTPEDDAYISELVLQSVKDKKDNPAILEAWMKKEPDPKYVERLLRWIAGHPSALTPDDTKVPNDRVKETTQAARFADLIKFLSQSKYTETRNKLGLILMQVSEEHNFSPELVTYWLKQNQLSTPEKTFAAKLVLQQFFQKGKNEELISSWLKTEPPAEELAKLLHYVAVEPSAINYKDYEEIGNLLNTKKYANLAANLGTIVREGWRAGKFHPDLAEWWLMHEQNRSQALQGVRDILHPGRWSFLDTNVVLWRWMDAQENATDLKAIYQEIAQHLEPGQAHSLLRNPKLPDLSFLRTEIFPQLVTKVLEKSEFRDFDKNLLENYFASQSTDFPPRKDLLVKYFRKTATFPFSNWEIRLLGEGKYFYQLPEAKEKFHTQMLEELNKSAQRVPHLSLHYWIGAYGRGDPAVEDFLKTNIEKHAATLRAQVQYGKLPDADTFFGALVEGNFELIPPNLREEILRAPRNNEHIISIQFNLAKAILIQNKPLSATNQQLLKIYCETVFHYRQYAMYEPNIIQRILDFLTPEKEPALWQKWNLSVFQNVPEKNSSSRYPLLYYWLHSEHSHKFANLLQTEDMEKRTELLINLFDLVPLWKTSAKARSLLLKFVKTPLGDRNLKEFNALMEPNLSQFTVEEADKIFDWWSAEQSMLSESVLKDPRFLQSAKLGDRMLTLVLHQQRYKHGFSREFLAYFSGLIRDNPNFVHNPHFPEILIRMLTEMESESMLGTATRNLQEEFYRDLLQAVPSQAECRKLPFYDLLLQVLKGKQPAVSLKTFSPLKSNCPLFLRLFLRK